MPSTFTPTGSTLAGIRLFRELEAEDRERLAELCHGRRVPAGRELLHDGEPSSEVYFIVSGKVRATIFAHSGKEVSFRDLGSGESVGDLSAIDGKPRSATVVTLEETTVVGLSSREFWTVLEQFPQVTRALLVQLTGIIRALSERVVEYSTLGVKNRIHAELLRIATPDDGEPRRAFIRPVPTHAEMASRLSTHREAVTRELGHLTTAGLLKREGDRLVVGDLAALRRMVDEVKGT